MLADAHGFVFDLDGTLVRRSQSGPSTIAGAVEVIDAVRASGRPLVVFTNASHTTPARLARELRSRGLDLAEAEVLTPVCSAIAGLAASRPSARVLLIGTPAVRDSMAKAGLNLLRDADAAEADVVFVAHPSEVTISLLETAARAVIAGATLLTSNYARAYAGANGLVLSHGAMVAAAIAKAAAQRPAVVGKPSRVAAQLVSARLGMPGSQTIVVGDDVTMDIALAKLAGARSILVLSGISGKSNGRVPEARQPDLVVESVANLLPLLS